MKQCRNCQEWIHRDFQYCPVCGEKQVNSANQPNNSGVLITIIVLLVIGIISGIALYMYKGGAFDSFLVEEIDSTLIYNDSTSIEIQDIPSELYLTSATFVNNQTVMLDLKISRKGVVSGTFRENGVNDTRTINGKINKEDGIITIRNDRAAISLILSPNIDNLGSYDCTWEYKGKSGVSYFYPTEKPNEPTRKIIEIPSNRNKDVNQKKSTESDSTIKSSKAKVDTTSVSHKVSQPQHKEVIKKNENNPNDIQIIE